MSNSSNPFSPYTPPRVWSPATPSGGAFASINRPVAGHTHELELPVGKHPLQLYSMGTPNGQKVTILLEELLAAVFASRLAPLYGIASICSIIQFPISAL